MTKRLKWALIGGAVLGIICVVGAYFRSVVQPRHHRLGRRCSLGYNQQKQKYASGSASGVFGFVCFLQLHKFSGSNQFCRGRRLRSDSGSLVESTCKTDVKTALPSLEEQLLAENHPLSRLDQTYPICSWEQDHERCNKLASRGGYLTSVLDAQAFIGLGFNHP